MTLFLAAIICFLFSIAVGAGDRSFGAIVIRRGAASASIWSWARRAQREQMTRRCIAKVTQRLVQHHQQDVNPLNLDKLLCTLFVVECIVPAQPGNIR